MSHASRPPPVRRPAPGTSARTSPRPASGPPLRDAVIDGAFVLLLGTVALMALATTFTGWEFLAVGIAGLALGALFAQLATSRSWPLVAPVLLSAAAFYLAGGLLCLRADGALWPTVRTWRLLTDEALFGWKDLLTTLPPVDGSGSLLVLPWVLGLAAGTLGQAFARMRGVPAPLGAPLPLIPLAATLSLVILLGVARPQSLWAQGAVFGCAAAAWLALRGQRTNSAMQRHAGRGSRLLVGTALVGAAALLSLPVAGWASGSDDGRLLLRPQVDPPFDVGQYPSPLASFRRYVDMKDDPGPENLYDRPLFTITGVPAGTRVRFASLTDYDGVVWGAANNTVPGVAEDTYQRVSSTIDNPVEGRAVSATVTIEEGYSGVWLPVVGALQGLEFTVGDTAAKADSFRYNLEAATAVVPVGIRPGDRYTFTAVEPDDSLDPSMAPYEFVGPAAQEAAFLETQANEWAGRETAPMEQVFAIASHLKNDGSYSDGVVEAEKIYTAGHFRYRLADGFVNYPIMAGNDEQYAAVMALLANRVGVPARVVMGAVVPAGGQVVGADVQAWVEVQVSDGSWRTLPTEQFMGDQRPAKLPPQSDRNLTGANVPPPAPIPPPSTIDDQTDTDLKERKTSNDGADDQAISRGLPRWVKAVLVLGGIPVLLVGSVLCSIVLVKVWRRRRRRRKGKVSARVVGAWNELVDHARDLGQDVTVSPVSTRREQSGDLGTPEAPRLARIADSHVFGPTAPAEEAASSFWSEVTAERKAMSAAVGRWRRLRAWVSVASFRHGPRATARPTTR